MGNGGSAADAQHLASEMVGRFREERRALPAIALTTDSSTMTSLANDYGYENVFARQLQALAKEGDLVVAISTSGNSPNILRALEIAGQIPLHTAGLGGNEGGKMKALCQHCITVPSGDTARIQEMHILIGHILCGYLEKYSF
jgi:D-sedoheptulose 7-phosphate isomerase